MARKFTREAAGEVQHIYAIEAVGNDAQARIVIIDRHVPFIVRLEVRTKGYEHLGWVESPDHATVQQTWAAAREEAGFIEEAYTRSAVNP